MSQVIKTDLCVIGGGSGGLSVAAGAAQMGARVVLIEAHKMGGDCLNYGCVPSKALLSAAKHAHAMTTGGPFGVTPVTPEVDFAAAMAHVKAVIAGIEPHDSVERFESLGVQVLQDKARFVGPREVEAGQTRVQARRFVIATGSTAFVPKIPGLDQVPYLTNETLFDLTKRPEHLIVVGAGPIGMEMAQAFGRLGSRVTVVEGATALNRDDPAAAALVASRLRSEGIDILEQAKVERVSATGNEIEVKATGNRTVTGSHLLVAIGRRPNIDNLGLEVAEIQTDGPRISVDARLRTTNRKVYAIGDVASALQFTHVAGYQAGVVIRAALFGMPAKASDHHIPRVTYTDPEIASIGPSEAELRAEYGAKLEVLQFDYAENDRARAEGQTDGFVKVMVVKGKPLAATIVGAQAGELIQTWALAIANGLKIGAVAGMVSPYPTLGELNKRAAGQYYVPRLFQSALVKRMVRTIQRF